MAFISCDAGSFGLFLTQFHMASSMSNGHVHRDNSGHEPSGRAYSASNLRQTPPHRNQQAHPPPIPMLQHQRIQRLSPPSNRVMCHNFRFRAANALRSNDGPSSPERSILLLLHVSSLPSDRMGPGILLE